MSIDALPPEVVAILRERFHTLEAVEALVALHAAPRPWPVSEVAATLGVEREVARSALEELAGGRFVVPDAAMAFRYAPKDAATAAAATALVRTYRTARLDVMRQMTENAMERIRSSAATAFADAFRFGKGRKDG